MIQVSDIYQEKLTEEVMQILQEVRLDHKKDNYYSDLTLVLRKKFALAAALSGSVTYVKNTSIFYVQIKNKKNN